MDSMYNVLLQKSGGDPLRKDLTEMNWPSIALRAEYALGWITLGEAKRKMRKAYRETIQRRVNEVTDELLGRNDE